MPAACPHHSASFIALGTCLTVPVWCCRSWWDVKASLALSMALERDADGQHMTSKRCTVGRPEPIARITRLCVICMGTLSTLWLDTMVLCMTSEFGNGVSCQWRLSKSVHACMHACKNKKYVFVCYNQCLIDSSHLGTLGFFYPSIWQAVL